MVRCLADSQRSIPDRGAKPPLQQARTKVKRDNRRLAKLVAVAMPTWSAPTILLT
jgi:hypothetical protein